MGIVDDADPEIARENEKRFFTARQAKFRLDPGSPEGDLKIGSKVGDFDVNLDSHGLVNLKVHVRARLRSSAPRITAARLSRTKGLQRFSTVMHPSSPSIRWKETSQRAARFRSPPR